MAISTYKIYLMEGVAGTGSGLTWSKLVDIKEFPDLGGTPEMLETTTLSDPIQTFIAGIQSLDALEFPANYDVDEFQTLKGKEGTTRHYAVWFGTNSSGEPDGHNGQFSFDGELSVYPVGGGVNSVVDMNITIAPSTPISFSKPTI